MSIPLAEIIDPLFLKDRIVKLDSLDVALSTRATESTLSSVLSKLDAIDNALATVATDKLRTSLVDALPVGDNWIGRTKIGDGTNIPQVADLRNIKALTVMTVGSMVQGYATGPDVAISDEFSKYIWDDPTEYTITELSWTQKGRLRLQEHRMGYDAMHLAVSYKVKGDGTNTVYVRVTLDGTEVASASTTATTYQEFWHHFPIHRKFAAWREIKIEAYVSGGTGYIIDMHGEVAASLPLMRGRYNDWTFPAVRTDADGYLQVKTVGY